MRRTKIEVKVARQQLLSYDSVKRWLSKETVRAGRTQNGYLYRLGVLAKTHCISALLVSSNSHGEFYLVL
jgi:hypothetical protein